MPVEKRVLPKSPELQREHHFPIRFKFDERTAKVGVELQISGLRF
jgi:hypothetical protein